MLPVRDEPFMSSSLLVLLADLVPVLLPAEADFLEAEVVELEERFSSLEEFCFSMVERVLKSECLFFPDLQKNAGRPQGERPALKMLGIFSTYWVRVGKDRDEAPVQATNQTSNSAPWPTSESTSIRPPCS